MAATIVVATCLVPGAVSGQATGRARQGSSPGSPPTPLGPGVRLTYYSSAASVRGSREEAVLDPQCDASQRDCWIDPATGSTYSNREVPTASGQGITQVDILWMDGRTCVARLASFGQDVASGRLVPNGIGAFATVGTCSDWWWPPATLRARPAVNTRTDKVVRGPLTLNGRRVEVVSIGAYGRAHAIQRTFDAASGLLLQASSRTTGGAVTSISGSGQVQAGAGSTALTYVRLLGTRAVPVNATPQALPAEVAGVQGLTYRCQQQMQMPGTPGMALPCQLQLTVTQRGAGWLLASAVRHTANVGGVPTTDQWETVISATGPGGHYLAPALLATWRTGQLLDRDAHTGVTLRVAQADTRGILLVFEWPGEQQQFLYDRKTGWLTGFVTQSQVGAMTMRTAYELAGVR